jgi:hypothetical protein
MNNQKRKLVLGLYILLIIVIECFILWLFPDTGFFPSVLPWTVTIILTLGFGYLLSGLIKRSLKNWLVALLFVTLLIVQTVFQLWAVPKDWDGDSFSRISDAVNAYQKYDKIQFDNFSNLSAAERTVCIYKFENILPDTLIIFTIDSLKNQSESVNPRTYLIQRTENKSTFDKTKLNIIESDTSTLILEYYCNSDTLKYRMIPNFFKGGGGGYNDRTISLTCRGDNLGLTSGIEKLLYYILRVVDKPTANKSYKTYAVL